MTESRYAILVSFTDFFIMSYNTGFGLTEVILKKAEKDVLSVETCRTIHIQFLNMKNCKGQLYGNGANMVGIYKMVQLKKHKLECYVPTFVGAYITESSYEVQMFF